MALSISDIKSKSISWLLWGVGTIPLLIIKCKGITSVDMNDIINALYALLPGIMLILVALCTGKAGYGDGLVVLVLGLELGAAECILIVFVGLVFLSVFSLVLLLLHKVKRNSKIPFLPFLSLGWIIIECVVKL